MGLILSKFVALYKHIFGPRIDLEYSDVAALEYHHGID